MRTDARKWQVLGISLKALRRGVKRQAHVMSLADKIDEDRLSNSRKSSSRTKIEDDEIKFGFLTNFAKSTHINVIPCCRPLNWDEFLDMVLLAFNTMLTSSQASDVPPSIFFENVSSSTRVSSAGAGHVPRDTHHGRRPKDQHANTSKDPWWVEGTLWPSSGVKSVLFRLGRQPENWPPDSLV